jgi:hypothetical protein
MSIRKYHSELGGNQHNGARLNWPGIWTVFPFWVLVFRTTEQEEIENLDLQYDFKFKCLFCGTRIRSLNLTT